MGETKLCECGCNKVMLAYRANGKQNHFWRGHGNSKSIKTICAHCSTPCFVEQWRIEQFPKVFCSRKCSAANRISFVEQPCSICGKPVTRKRFQLNVQVLCGMPCRKKFQQMTANKKTVHCSYCGIHLLVFPCKAKQKNFYCNPECRSRHITGAKNPAYTTGAGRNCIYGENWKKQRRLAILRDKKTCRLCGVRQTEPRKLHVHHIKPIACFGGDWESANNTKNLITLCSSPCHRIIERNPLLLNIDRIDGTKQLMLELCD